MTRRDALQVMLAAAPLVHADEGQDMRDFLGQVATALSEGDAAQFLKGFDRAMPGYEMLAVNVEALVEQTNVQSSIEVLSDDGTETTRMLELDWFLQLTPPEPGSDTVRRRQRVKCTVVRQGKRWRIMQIEPLSLFAPPGQ